MDGEWAVEKQWNKLIFDRIWNDGDLDIGMVDGSARRAEEGRIHW